jgi:hypothetical protein
MGKYPTHPPRYLERAAEGLRSRFMLEPDARQLLLDALRPPPGYTLDLAVCTTYSLDLLALMIAPVAFAMFDRQRSDGSPVDDPVAILQALREHASRITLFCQAGQIAIPPEFRSLFVYLEDSVYPVVPPNAEAIFHPKVWYLRFLHENDGSTAYRLLCLSRNLTFDRSWDTMLRLDGVVGEELKHPELERFARSLTTLAPTRPLSDERAEAIRVLGRQFSRVSWSLPDGFEYVKFWPLGDDGANRWPFDGRRDRILVISPFVTEGALSRLSKHRRDSILVSRAETLDQLGGNALKHLAERLVLSADATSFEREEPKDNAEASVTSTEASAESADRRLEGLHAKLYVADAGWRARVWTGSANATDAAFHGNVEFLVELEGRKDRCGVHATIGDHKDRLGLRRLVEPYDPAQEDPLEPTDAERIEQRLDRARRAIGGMRFTATCSPTTPDRWRLTLEGDAVDAINYTATIDGIDISVRPVTVSGVAAVRPVIGGGVLSVNFEVSEPAITPYFAVTLKLQDDEVGFLIAGELVNPPPGRSERVLSNILSNRADLIRFLLLLLGNIEDALAAFDSAGDGQVTSDWGLPPGSEALLEPLVRAYSRDPAKLRDIERVMLELGRTPEGDSLLPEHWHDIWDPIVVALAKEPAL